VVRVFSVNLGDFGKKSGYSRKSGESGLGRPGVSRFHSRNPNSQCHANQPSKMRDIADLKSMEYTLPIP
jgi:hypothetical protein